MGFVDLISYAAGCANCSNHCAIVTFGMAEVYQQVRKRLYVDAADKAVLTKEHLMKRDQIC